MQTIQFLQTVKWIKSQLSDKVRAMILSPEILHAMGTKGMVPMEISHQILIASHELSTVQPRLRTHQFAPIILEEFGLGKLLDAAFPVEIALLVVRSDREPSKEAQELIIKISSLWNTLISCVGPLERITTPKEVVEEKDFDEILTIELRLKENVDPPAETVADVLKQVNNLYGDVCHFLGDKETGKLVTIYATSGSSFRFDFKGSGEPIKEIKNLLVEVWNIIRHTKGEAVRQKNRAVLSSLKVLEKIKSKRSKEVISDEDADKLCEKIILSTLKLFDQGALLREIPEVETVSNRELAEARLPKLLTGDTEPSKPKTAKKKAKTVSAKKKTKRLSESEEKSNSETERE